MHKQLENKMQSAQLVVTSTKDLILWHKRLGYPSFKVFEELAPSIYKSCNKEMLKCEACELAKHSRTVYPASGNRSLKPFDLIHSDVQGPINNTSTSGCCWFVTLIDCYSRTIWVSLLKVKSDVLSVFQKAKSDVLSVFHNFHKMIETQFGSRIKALRTDNGTEYTNDAFQEFL